MFPYRDRILNLVDYLAARIKGFTTLWARDGDNYSDVANL